MDDKLMSPAASPKGVTRRGRRPLMLGYAVVALFCGFIAFVAYGKRRDDGAVADKKPEPRVQGESPAQIARRLMSERRAPAPKAPAPPVTTPTVLVASLDAPPLPEGAVAGGPRSSQPPAAQTGDGDEERKARRDALQRALSGSTSVQAANRGGSSTAATGGVAAELERVRREQASLSVPSPAANYQQAMQAAMAAAQAASMGGAQPGAAPGLPPPPLPAGPTEVGAFNRPGGSDRFRLDTELEPPRSPYILQPGRRGIIPAVLDSAVNSELPGPIIGHVAVNVYDSPTGKHLLIPQGAELFGEYASGVVFGQSRLMVAWQRITIDGHTIDIGEMPGTDSIGRAGFTDLVDNHYFRMFSSALLLSGVTAGVAMSQDVGTGNSQRVTAGSAMSQALGQQLGQTASQFLQKNMNVAPTLDIRPGYRFNIVVTKDVVFKRPYRRAS